MADKINLTGAKVFHKIFREGKITGISDSIISVEFQTGVKKLDFPGVFEKFMKCEDPALQEFVESCLEEKKEIENEEKEIRHQELFQYYQASPEEEPHSNIPGNKKYKRENIAFKCNFCDGGKKKNGIGFCGVCSDGMVGYNIEEARHSWCENPDSLCRQYYDGLITREELDASAENDGFVCYECQMLRDWTAFSGYVLTGKNKGKPLMLNKVQVNSLAVLTARYPGDKEKDRFIFGVFLVDEAYDGDNSEHGYVTTKSKYKLSLKLNDARKIRFWKYYRNPNSPEEPKWGQGLHRYFSDNSAANILKDIAEIKKGTADEKLAEEFFEHFCSVNGILPEKLSEAEGAIK